MKALKNKWSSRRGASILLALLFLLVSMLVGSSVLMAAASNAGKINSNRVEHQKYLTVSSALTFVVEELKNMKYTGGYAVDSADNGSETVDHTITNKYTITGTWKQKGLEGWDAMEAVLPLQDNLDYVFARLFTNKTDEEDSDPSYEEDIDGETYTITNFYTYTWDGEWTGDVPSASYTLKLKAEPDDAEITGGIEHTVKITVKITYPANLFDTSSTVVDLKDCPSPIKIDLTAALLDPGDESKETNKMYAQLESAYTLPDSLRAPEAATLRHTLEEVEPEGEAGTLTWKLKSISKIEGGST